MMIAMVLISVAVALIGVGVAVCREHQLPVHADAPRLFLLFWKYL